MTREPFDRHLRRLRRDRAARKGLDLFLLDRAFDDCLDRVRTINRRFGSALLVGTASPDWAEALRDVAHEVAVFDPSPMLGDLSGDEDRFDFGKDRYDLIVAVGTLDSVNDLPVAFRLLHRALKADAPLIGAMAGGDTLPALRSALIEADRGSGRIVARVHPRVDGPTLAQLLANAGFANPVVDVDRVGLRYNCLADLVRDLRAMAATSLLAGPRTPLTSIRWRAAEEAFAAQAVDGRTLENIDILHFHGWTRTDG